MAKQNLSPAVRAGLFAQQTRQYKQEISSMVFKEGETRTVDLPKTRFLSKIYLRIKGTFTCSGSSSNLTLSKFGMYRMIRQIRLKINNGFTPFQIGGSELSLYNLVGNFNQLGEDNFKIDMIEKNGQKINKVNYTLELPITINDRDSIGLLLLQNEQTVTTLEVDCGNIMDCFNESGNKVTDYTINMTPILETYSIPQNPDAIPDYSIIKLVNQQIENVTSTGDMVIKLPVGLTYRKIIIYIAKDSKFEPIEHDKLDKFAIMLNQADSPYNISADQIAYENRKDYGGKLPAGCYVFDFSSQGIANMGGSRDYIDTERLTEFWLKINFKELEGTNNNVYIISEKLSRLV